MSKNFARLVGWTTSLAAVFVISLLLMPQGAVGSDRQNVAATHRADRYVFGQDAVIDQPTDGNVQVYGGSVVVRAVIAGNLVVFGGSLVFEGEGRVNGDVIAAGGSIRNVDGRIGGKLYAPDSFEGAAAMMAQSAVKLSLLFVWLLAAIALTLMSGREVRLSSVEIRASALHCFALGLVALTSFVLTAIVFSYLVPYVIGVPLLAALGVFAVLTKIYGTIAVFHAVGTLVAGSRTRQQLERRRWLRGDLAMTVIGVLLLGALRMIPGVGTFVWGCASIFGVGVALATKFGRREPWFLAWRTLES